ncbi:hypothetical protein [Maribacter sp. Hel_I_7]|uniref:hypothetical protein n=1 Tax=Maribacter sp. Hel_I_7 TaxID=1249997 RepID=UPI00047E7ACF|nr:hypothetical protein [Maribacter sp. Hel_I_7]
MLKKITRFFKNWLQQWKDYFQMRTNDRLTNKLFKAQIKDIKERTELKKEILEYIQSEFKVNPRSKHIPMNIRRQIVEGVYNRFRSRMEPLKVNVNYSLQFAQ